MTPAAVLSLLRIAAAADDVEAHATAFAKAVAGLIAMPGELDPDEYEPMAEAIRRAALRTSELPEARIAGDRLVKGALSTAYTAYMWSLPADIRALKDDDRMTADMADYVTVFRNDLDSAVRLARLRRRHAQEPPAELIPAFLRRVALVH